MRNTPSDLGEQVSRALAEDIGGGDITAALLDDKATGSGRVIAREDTVLCGRPWVDEVYRQLAPKLAAEWHFAEGDSIPADSILYTVHGNARVLLTAERTALNFLQLLCAIAARSRELAAAVAHTGCRLLDTRKTLPGLRSAQKYAVRAGGCHNHRMGLYDAFLIKENHIRASGGIARAIGRARQSQPGKPVEIEVCDLDELEEAIAAGADIALLDNFSPGQIRSAVALAVGRCKLEASGGIGEETLVEIAETGVDYISLGILTKHCRAADLSFLLD
ncbi:MAG: carboxylating nicotinate-nucleotide diphosphorylase [Gammaproteobacteria bacterium]|nr:carboxylating nicotinate-nucleotide diphosphorylase [Gammaproteobacteria bacterium]MYA66226.1 carboxylating nicotinate-nucleotide diphosphorylase [Gammaproteobacteria bacterium]MYF01316.1 carboxylating nicotinate-nucleotide diphosphorylase [Gammaproteobacteria bacterium]MYH45033.1 carboxylating nicotinate-nucleotide diphosphorylase [Gammaproteobacteria bacterium]MYL14060.1 carboxylating nicotinate-nucleotide diphosphorylase [Gammaproteobacteria bacterium]